MDSFVVADGGDDSRRNLTGLANEVPPPLSNKYVYTLKLDMCIHNRNQMMPLSACGHMWFSNSATSNVQSSIVDSN